MSMISEQIEELRLMAEMFVNGEPYGNLLRRAAYTIEMLSEKAREPKQEWIPCSEKLPELSIHCTDPLIGEWDNSEPVLIYHKDKRFECEQAIAVYTNGFEDVGEPVLYGWVEVEGCEEIRDVVAWMPLPKPWKGADDE